MVRTDTTLVTPATLLRPCPHAERLVSAVGKVGYLARELLPQVPRTLAELA